MRTIAATGAAAGLATGKVKWYDTARKAAPPRAAADSHAELARFEAARANAVARLGELYEKAVEASGEEAAAVFEIYQMMLEDDDFVDMVKAAITTGQSGAEQAVEQAGRRYEEMFAAMDNEYMRGRAADVRDITNRLLDALAGREQERIVLAEPVVLAAEDLTPSETVQLDKSKVLAFVTQRGSANSHTAILARTMGIPAVVDAGDALSAKADGEMAVVDGSTGQLVLAPDEKTVAHYQSLLHSRRQEQERLKRLKDLPAQTLDGVTIQLYANIGSPQDVENALENGAEGIGLFRTEFLFMQAGCAPDEEKQFSAYRQVLSAMAGRPVVIRTMDIGADKQAGCFDLEKEENPAMGMRAIRLSLTRLKAEFITQLRALYRASVYGKLGIMFPMVASVNEVERLLEMAAEVRASLAAEGAAMADDVQLGIMVETPAAALIGEELAEKVDFFSIGTNDLTQYTLAMDRQSEAIHPFFDPRHPAVLRLIEMTVDAAHKKGIWVGICGELAADTALAGFFARIGVDELSVSAPALPGLKQAIRKTDTRASTIKTEK